MLYQMKDIAPIFF